MSAAAHNSSQTSAPHLPVLIDAILKNVDPSGVWLVGVDRDPMVFEMAKAWAGDYGDRLQLIEGRFSDLDTLAADFLPLDGVVLDLGVSSMQLDQPERGFSFLRDGPLDMRMGSDGPSAADLVNEAGEALIADVLFQYGEERASRRIARAIIAARPIETTAQLAEIIEGVLPKSKPGQSHPATRSFQAIRIAVNDEFGQLISGLEAAEKALKPGGYLAVVTFHSLEDRVVKKFIAARAGRNPRARSAKLRVARRLNTPPRAQDRAGLGLPKLVGRNWSGEKI
jgi:16S rRNA (cytosine1402-N4)-methyltransferase